MINIIECNQNVVVASATTWAEAYSVRDSLQRNSLDSGYDLTKLRYAVRPVQED